MSAIALRNLLLLASMLATAAALAWGVHSYNEWIRDGVREQWRAQVAAAQLVENRETKRRLERQGEADAVFRESLDRAAADRARAGDAADSLRKQLAAFTAARRPTGGDRPAAGPGPGEQGLGPLDLLAVLFSRADDASGELADYAARLRAAGQLCEARYDALIPR